MSNTMDIEYYLHGKDKAVIYFLKKKKRIYMFAMVVNMPPCPFSIKSHKF